MAEDGGYLTAREAAAALGVTPATLYAYVSRGLVRSEATGGRARRYHAADIAALSRRRRPADPEAMARSALEAGAPVLDSAITLILDGRLYYRGRDALALARSASVAEVAALLWEGDPTSIFVTGNLPAAAVDFAAARKAVAALPAPERCMALLPLAAARDPRGFDRAPAAVAATGARILRLMTAVVAGAASTGATVDAVLARAWRLSPEQQAVLRAALILCADHELNASAFTVRCAASAGTSLYHALAAGIAALRGTRHGGVTERAAALLASALEAADLGEFCAARLRRGERFPGFGHPLYPGGDPRGRLLLELLAERGGPGMVQGLRLAEMVHALAGLAPNIDFALALMGSALALPPGAPLAVFMLGRSLGWIAHAAEQYAAGNLIRPRARYVGPAPRQEDRVAAAEIPNPAGVERAGRAC